jgi:hypothetical protein
MARSIRPLASAFSKKRWSGAGEARHRDVANALVGGVAAG